MGNTSKKSNVILTDFKPNEKWDFLTILNEISGQEWDVEYKKTNNLHGHRFANLYRLLLYFIFPLKILLKSNRYNKIIGWQQFYGLNIAFFSRLFHLKKKNELYVMTFIYKKKKGGGVDFFIISI